MNHSHEQTTLNEFLRQIQNIRFIWFYFIIFWHSYELVQIFKKWVKLHMCNTCIFLPIQQRKELTLHAGFGLKCEVQWLNEIDSTLAWSNQWSSFATLTPPRDQITAQTFSMKMHGEREWWFWTNVQWSKLSSMSKITMIRYSIQSDYWWSPSVRNEKNNPVRPSLCQ